MMQRQVTVMRTDVLRTRTRSAAAFCFFSALVTLAASAFTGCGAKEKGGSGFVDPTTGGSSSGASSGASSGSSGDDGSSSLFGDAGDLGTFTLIDGAAPDRAAPAGNCKLPGLWCYQTSTCTTELSGTVFDPAGQVPLSNVVVYVPADPSKALTKITTGTNSCSACSSQIDNYMALAVTDVNGHFTMKGVPATTAVPVVVQIGKWRREVTLASVTACKGSGTTYVNKVPDGVLRLPRNRGEGDIPQMAVATGGADDLGCFLREMGLDAAEYGAPNAGKRLDIYQGVNGPNLTGGGGGNCASNGCPLWASKSSLEYYDIVLLACEGATHPETKGGSATTASPGPATTNTQALHDWLSEGGKVFATHFHYFWFTNAPTDFQNIATWLGTSAAGGGGTYTVDTSFNRGQVFDNWLTSPGVAAATGTSITLSNVATSVGDVSSNAQRWIYGPPNPLRLLTTPDAGDETKYLSFLTPIGGNKVMGDAGESTIYCGKAVFSDLHTSGRPSADVPGSCPTTGLTAQQKALEYLFFDLAACVAPPNAPPPTPPENPPPPPPPPM
jgi:hypothetical protein